MSDQNAYQGTGVAPPPVGATPSDPYVPTPPEGYGAASDLYVPTPVEPVQSSDDRDLIIAAQAQEIAALRGRRNLPSSEKPHSSHVVVADDTLESVASKYGTTPELIYANNSVSIEGEAGARGFRDSEGGRLLFPGTALKVPLQS